MSGPDERYERDDVDPAKALGAAKLPLPEGQPRGFVPPAAQDDIGEAADEQTPRPEPRGER